MFPKTLALCLIVTGLAGYAGLASLENYIARRSPQAAMNLPTASGVAASKLAMRKLRARILNQSKTDSDAIENDIIALAKYSFAAEPLIVQGPLAFGLVANSSREEKRRLFEAMVKLNRRESVASGWLAEDALRRGDNRKAQKFLRLVLMRDNEATENIARQLVTLVALKDGKKFLMELFQTPGLWQRAFWIASANDKKHLLDGSSFLLAVSEGDIKIDDDIYQLFAYRLVLAEEYAVAYQIHSQRMARSQRIANGQARLDFNPLKSLDPFMWSYNYTNPKIFLVPDPNTNTLSVEVDGNSSVQLAKRLVLLPSGKFMLTGAIGNVIGYNENVNIYFDIACNRSGAETLTASISATKIGKFGLALPTSFKNCSIGWITLRVENSGSEQGAFNLKNLILIGAS